MDWPLGLTPTISMYQETCALYYVKMGLICEENAAYITQLKEGYIEKDRTNNLF